MDKGIGWGKATTQQILQYIQDLVYLERWQLCDKFGYTRDGSTRKLNILKHYGLVANPMHNKWNLTLKGIRRLEYYVAHQTEDTAGK